MGYESGSTSQNGQDEDDEEEYEEVGGGNRLLGFMFGNVDGSGDLDIDYLDEDAKEHLAALADKLGQSLTDIDLSVKSPPTTVDTAEQDYDEKAEDAVDYEDIDEQYEGPEIQATTEEDYLLPKKDYYATEVSVATFEHTTSVFDDENYDEDEEELDIDHQLVDNNADVQPESPSGGELGDSLTGLSEVEKCPEDQLPIGSFETETLAVDLADHQEEEPEVLEETLDCKSSAPLPILYVEDGTVILRFSEIFGIHEPPKKGEKRERRYSVPREKYTSMDTSDIVEDDEEAFLKGSSQDFSFRRVAQVTQVDISDDELESANYGVHQGASITDQLVDEQRKDSCLCAEPMKLDLPLNLSSVWSPPLFPKFYPIDQQDWEDKIIWDGSPSVSDNATESSEISGPESEASEIELGRSQNFQPKQDGEPDERDNGSFLRSCPIILEPFGSRKFSELRNLPYSVSRYHPQLLRLESRLEIDNPSHLDVRSDVTKEVRQSDAIRRFSKLTLENRDIEEGSWLDKIIWDPHQSIAKPKLILDLQDEQMLFEVLDNKDSKHLRLHAGAMIITRSVKSSGGDALELHGHGGPSGARFNIANDKFYLNRKISQQLKSHSKKRTAHGVKVLHSIPALKLQTMKPKLSNKDIANFHRPKALWYPHVNEMAVKEQGKLPTQGVMKVILKSLGGKGSKLHVDADENISSVKAKASKKLDLKPPELVKIFYSGKELEDDKSLAVQNVRPNSLLHLVRTKINLWPRAQKVPGENKSLRPPGAFKRKSDLSVKDGHVFLMEYCEERPLLLGNIGMGARLCTYYQKSAPGDQSGTFLRNGSNTLGSVLVLDPADKSPFLGDIKAGYSQSCLETNMYRAPIFPHKVALTDYLLVRSAKGKLSIRRIDRLNVVGQQEPHMEVMAPGTKGVQAYIMNRLLVYMYREFRAAKKSDSNSSISIRADELSAQFPSMSEAFLRKRLKHCADLQRGRNGQLLWVMRRNFRIPLEEELRRMVTPENVCAYESMLAGLYRLKRLGISRLTHPTGLSSAMNQLPDEAIALAAASHIERELQITPWNLSSNFVACTSQDRENIERLEITGVGDPSGRGLGFSYVRIAPKAPISNAMVKKKAAVNRVGSTVTGTDADLRRLSMEAAREVLLKFNVPEEQIAKQTRWHRIAMIRKLSSEQAAAGFKVDPTTISKYARGQRMSFLQLQQQTREKCQEIWDRQLQSLSAFDGDENESDSEANSDLDSFAGDLENLLDAEEFEEGEEGSCESKHEKADGVRGLKMRRRPIQAQAEEEIEDEAAEAAELCRMLMDDEEAERKKKKKTRALGKEVGFSPGSQLTFGFENSQRAKKSNTNVKQITFASQPDGSHALKESTTREPKKEERLLIKKNLSGKMKAMKKNDVTNMGLLNKKVKILGDGIKIIKEKKSARESFVCGACGQLGHMRTNKNCPKYGEDLETQVESTDLGKSSLRSNSQDTSAQPQPQPQPRIVKKLISKGATKIALVEASEDDITSSKAKVLKVKCGSDKIASSSAPLTDRSLISDAETGSKFAVKVNKIVFSNKMKPEDVQVEPHKPSIVIRPPMEIESKQTRKKIIIKRPKENNMDQVSQEGSTGLETRKTKKITELSSFEKHREVDSKYIGGESARRKAREDKRRWEEEEKRRVAEREREERARRVYEEQRRMQEKQDSLAEITKYEEAIRREREEEELQKAKKKKKMKRPEVRDDYIEDLRPRRIDRRIPERDRHVKRRPVVELGGFGAEYAPQAKRRRGGEVGLANILETIVETLKGRVEVSYLFLKPVTKKEAPDYLDIIKHPMDLSTIREKVRRLEYKSREEFRHDVWQITYNAHAYNNGRNPGIPPLADQLLELCDYLLHENDTGLTEAEEGIDSRDI